MGHGQRIMANLRYISVPCQKLDCSGPSIVAKNVCINWLLCHVYGNCITLQPNESRIAQN